MDRTNRIGRGTAILLALACGQATLAADTAPQGPYGAVKQILETSTSTLGEPLRYPVGTPSIRTVVVTLLPGETTARHHHDTPLFVYILEGEVSVEYDGVGARNYRAGDAFMEGMSAPHAATNVGKTPVRILATFLEATAPEPPRKTLTIGIIGGVSWVSSLEYYRLMNQMVRNRLGPLQSANILMYSIEFGTFSEQERLAEAGDWRPLRETMRGAARRLKAGGADFIVIASNTMNSSADDIEQNVGIPVLRIMDPTARKISERGMKRVALLGTKYTMENPFWRDHVKARYGIEVVTPTLAERDDINRIIFDELCADVIKEESRKRYLQIIDRLVRDEKVEGVVLGCTEIPLLVKQADVGVPVFDTTAIHSEAAVDRSLGERR